MDTARQYIENAKVIRHGTETADYRLLVLSAPRIAQSVRPGQFVHLRVPGLSDAVLRRPFSVFQARGDELSILYKVVGRGTQAMCALSTDEPVSVIGPLGNGFPEPAPDAFPILIAGGYGVAALYLLAERSPKTGVLFLGAATAADLLGVRDMEQLGWTVHAATEDGSAGHHGLATDALDAWLAGERAGRKIEAFACGPNGMLKAVGERAQKGGWKAWLSMDRHMGCGVGACLTCVQKIQLSDGGWDRVRVCREGPIFECRSILWEEKE